MATFQPVIKWSGSKRPQAETIKSLMPTSYRRYYEPFVGGGSMLYSVNPNDAIAGDVCKPLISLWNSIKTRPHDIKDGYRIRWDRFQKEGAEAFYAIREEFNRTLDNPDPNDFLFLLRTCANGLVRFNKKGFFNTPCHLGRPGIHPDRLNSIIDDWNKRIEHTIFLCDDFRNTLSSATHEDIVYLDPPYLNTKGMYGEAFDNQTLWECLDDLNHRNIKWLLSYDGKSGETDNTVDVPKELYRRHEYIKSGISSFKRIVKKEKAMVFDSLYLNYL